MDFLGAEAIEKIVAIIEFADVIEAEKLPSALAAGQPIRAWRAEFARTGAAGMVAARRIGAFDAAMQALGPFRRVGRFGGYGRRSLAKLVIAYRWGRYSERVDMGRVADEMEARLRAALSPTALDIIDDSESHRGHAGHDGSGESHFTVRLTAPAFVGLSRIARQRLVYAALGDLMAPGGIHALIIKAAAPGEA